MYTVTPVCAETAAMSAAKRMIAQVFIAVLVLVELWLIFEAMKKE